MEKFKIDFLDHVAIRVKDLDASSNWYYAVLGLEKHNLPKWGEFPVFMLANKTGVALFPADLNDEKLAPYSNNIKIDHFAFNVTNKNFDKAKKRYEELGLQYQVKDHFYFHSIYTKDPDGHIVELTTLVVDENDVYNSPPGK